MIHTYEAPQKFPTLVLNRQNMIVKLKFNNCKHDNHMKFPEDSNIC
jgi:hypothetical protein